jgi:AcrR family transcriptional regulator
MDAIGKNTAAAAPKVRRKRVRARDADATRMEIIDAAVVEFAEKGMSGARVEEIAARTATSKHMIYYYFGSKDGLYAAVLHRAFHDYRAAQAEIDYAALDPAVALATLVGVTFDAHVRNPHVVRIVMSENIDGGRHIAGFDFTARRARVMDTVGAILARGAAAGVFRADVDPLQFYLSASALSFGWVSNRFTVASVFEVDMDDETQTARRRVEVIETMLARCLLRPLGGAVA